MRLTLVQRPVSNSSIDYCGASHCDTVSSHWEIWHASSLTDDLFLLGQALSIPSSFDPVFPEIRIKRGKIFSVLLLFPPPQIRISFSLSWENKPDLFPQNTKTGVLSNGRSSLDKVLTANPLKQILTLKEIYSTAQFENEQESTLKRHMGEWQSSSSHSSRECLISWVHDMNEWMFACDRDPTLCNGALPAVASYSIGTIPITFKCYPIIIKFALWVGNNNPKPRFDFTLDLKVRIQIINLNNFFFLLATPLLDYHDL